jgi:hypothetical protein
MSKRVGKSPGEASPKEREWDPRRLSGSVTESGLAVPPDVPHTEAR